MFNSTGLILQDTAISLKHSKNMNILTLGLIGNLTLSRDVWKQEPDPPIYIETYNHK